MSQLTNRQRFEKQLAGQLTDRPIYAVYDWFVHTQPQMPWANFRAQGLGQINHAILTTHDYPNLEIKETTQKTDQGRVRRDVRWITSKGELHEWYLDDWRQAYFIKTPEDYRIMAHALADVRIEPTMQAFTQSEADLASDGITLGQPAMRRTPFQRVQIDFTGLEQFSLDIATQVPQLLDLLELMNDQLIRDFQAMATLPIRHLKLWENLTLQTMGPTLYRRHLVPVYQAIFKILNCSGQQLHVHYDGDLKGIASDIASLDFAGIDSFTGPPEGDMSAGEGRAAWPDKFLWMHPNLGWYRLEPQAMAEQFQRLIDAGGPTRYCLMISENIPPYWEQTIPRVLQTLRTSS